VLSGLVHDTSPLVLVANSQRTKISASHCNAAVAPVVETGTSDGTLVSATVGAAQPTLIGATSFVLDSGTGTALRSTIVGGSSSQPDIRLDTANNSGWYRIGTHGLGYSHNGTPGLQFFTDTGNSSKLALIPGEIATNDLGVASRRWRNVFAESFLLGNSGTLGIYYGSGSPEGNVTATIGSLYLNGTGGAGTSLYVKQSGTGNTGWVAK
jgi:hypothetical protein